MTPIDECDVKVGLGDVVMPDIDAKHHLSSNSSKAENQTLHEVLTKLTKCAERLLSNQNLDPITSQSDKSALVRLQFGATAGLRLARCTQPLRTEVLLSRTQLHFVKWLIPQNNLTRDWMPEESNFLGIIDGEQEALDSCIAVNNQHWADRATITHSAPVTGKVFGSNPTNGPGQLEIGMIELGGASLQIAYPLDESMSSNSNTSTSTSTSNQTSTPIDPEPSASDTNGTTEQTIIEPMSVNPAKLSDASLLPIETLPVEDRNVRQWKQRKVYVSSQLCFGANQFRARLLWLLIEQTPNQTMLQHPCYSSEYHESIDTQELMDRHCLTFPISHSQSPLNKSNPLDKYEVIGAYNSNACQALIRSALDLTKCQERFKYCARTELPAPAEHQHFRALSNFHYATRVFGLTMDTISWPDYERRTQEWCESQLPPNESNELRRQYSIHYCLTLQYAGIVITELFRFPTKQFDRIHFSGPNNGKGPQIDWTQGHLLSLLVNRSSTKAVRSPLKGHTNESNEFLTDNFISFAYADLCAHSRELNLWLILAFVTSILLATIGLCIRWQHTRRYKP